MLMNEELHDLCAQMISVNVYSLILGHIESYPSCNYVAYWNTSLSRIAIGIHDTEYFKDEDEVKSITEFKEYILEKTLEN